MNIHLPICYECDSCNADPFKRGGCNGPCPCFADPQQRDIKVLTELEECPRKKFSKSILRRIAHFIKPPKPPRVPHTAEELWRLRGQLLWAEVHTWSLTADDLPRPFLWLEKFLARLGCGECADDSRAWVAANPVPTDSHENRFAWGVRWHNHVNRKLDKTEMGVEEAREKWGVAGTLAI